MRRSSAIVGEDSQQQSIDMTETLRANGAGFVVVSDIVDFSADDNGNKQQHDQVVKLWEFTNAHAIVTSAGNEAHCNSTGDGLLLTLTYAPRRFDAIFEYCHELIEHMRTGAAARPVRIGVHIGQFQEVRLGQLRMAIGSGCNTCARIARIGDGGDVVVSQDLVHAWKQHVGANGLRRRLRPDIDEPPMEVLVKHGVSQTVRLVRHRGRTRTKLPRWIREIAHVDQRIRSLLQDIELDILLDLLEEDVAAGSDARDGGIETERIREDLSLRISVFAPPPGEKSRALHCTDFRWHHRNECTGRSRTKYTNRNGQGGPIAQAYRDDEPRFLNELPDPEADPDEYERAVMAGGVARKTVQGWSRRPRCILAVPFGIPGDRSKASGVLCVDSRHPIPLAPERLDSLGRALRQRYGGELGALWALRL